MLIGFLFVCLFFPSSASHLVRLYKLFCCLNKWIGESEIRHCFLKIPLNLYKVPHLNALLGLSSPEVVFCINSAYRLCLKSLAVNRGGRNAHENKFSYY